MKQKILDMINEFDDDKIEEMFPASRLDSVYLRSTAANKRLGAKEMIRQIRKRINEEAR